MAGRATEALGADATAAVAEAAAGAEVVTAGGAFGTGLIDAADCPGIGPAGFVPIAAPGTGAAWTVT